MKTYIIEYSSYKFLANVQEIDDNTTSIRVGSSDKYCVTIHVYDDESYVYISDLIYDPSCCLLQSLPKTEGTIALLHAALTFCKQIFPKTKYATLTDESAIPCGRGKLLPLPETYMLLYGETWYSSKFGATIHEWPKNKRDSMSKLLAVLKTKPQLHWDILWRDYLSFDMHQDDFSETKKKYESSSNWHAFFLSISDDKCVKWYTWIRDIFKLLSKGLVLSGTTWKINIPQPPPHFKYYVSSTPQKSLKPSYQGRRLFGGTILAQ